jgi:hypothetical protein
MTGTLQVTSNHLNHRRNSTVSDSGKISPSAPRTAEHSINRRKSTANARESDKQAKLATRSKSKTTLTNAVNKASQNNRPGKWARKIQQMLAASNVVEPASKAKGITRSDDHHDPMELDDDDIGTMQIDNNNDIMQLDDDNETTEIEDAIGTMQINDENEANEVNHNLEWTDIYDDDDDIAIVSSMEPMDSGPEANQETPTDASDEGNDINDNDSDTSMEEGETREQKEHRRRSDAPEPED